MIKINKVTTKSGDSGKTLGPKCQITPKFDDNIEFLGKLDELNCVIGLVMLQLPKQDADSELRIQDRLKDLEIGDITSDTPLPDLQKNEMKNLMLKIQNQIFDIGAIFFKQSGNMKNYISLLEENIEKYNENLPELDSFLLPSGSELVVHLHVARAYARNAERKFWKANKDDALNDIGIYLNRLSDLFFVFIRTYDNKKWVPGSI